MDGNEMIEEQKQWVDHASYEEWLLERLSLI